MCGITGIFSLRSDLDAPQLQSRVSKMCEQLIHRGPDDGNIWVDAPKRIALAHRRLSILDLSVEGRQPMRSANGRFVVVFNGEVYNFESIRKELEISKHAVSWRGHSDTEVMLEAFSAWGIEDSLKKFIGMFALAVFDMQKNQLTLARDRIGKKPLYYGWQGKDFIFASELKAMHAYPSFSPQVDRNSLALYLRYNYVPAPYSIYQGIYKLLPGTMLILSADGKTRENAFWSLKNVAEKSEKEVFHGNENELADKLDLLLRDAVKLRMISDVELGAFLSGGIDSSTVVALMQAQSNMPVRTFSIGLFDKGYNEAEYAGKVAKHLGTDHTEFYIEPKEAISVIPRLPAIFDEPFADSSQIPTYLISELARKYVTVALSGDGGDELFAGYNRYFLVRSIWGRISWIPKQIRNAVSKLLYSLGPEQWEKIIRFYPGFLKDLGTYGTLGDKFHKIASVLSMPDTDSIYCRLVSAWESPANILTGGNEYETIINQRRNWPDIKDYTRRMMYLDSLTYLPDDILTKVDRATMAVSLESRNPFLDHRVLEFAWKLPMEMLVRKGSGKHILRKVLYKYVPRPLIERPKMGFGIPISAWLRGPLKDWAENLLDEKRLGEEGFFKPEPVRKIWLEHLSGKRNWQFLLWSVLIFQGWLEKWEK